MKRVLFFVFAVVAGLSVSSCKKGSDDNVGTEGKFLVKSMVIELNPSVYESEADYRMDMTVDFDYTGGRLASVKADGRIYEGNDYYTDLEANLSFAYNGDRVAASYGSTISDSDGFTDRMEPMSVAMMYGANKAIASTRYNTEEGEKGSDITYDSYDQLVQTQDCYGRKYTNKFYWEDENVVALDFWYDESQYMSGSLPEKNAGRMGWEQWKGLHSLIADSRPGKRIESEWEKVVFEYSDEKNGINIDFSYFLNMLAFGANDMTDYLGIFGFYGKMSKNLPSKLNNDGTLDFYFEYDMGASGKVKKAKLMVKDLGKVSVCIGAITFKY